MSGDMKFGLVINGAPAGARTGAEHVEAAVLTARAARDAGFDLVAVGQHFLSPEYRYLQPIPLLSRLIPETGDMSLATVILLLPLLHPVEAAEQLATLDVLSGGRLVVGVGLGFREPEFAAFGVDKRDRAARQTEALELMAKLWSGQPFRHQGTFFRVDSPGSGLVPEQSPRPPIWVAAMNARSFARAVEAGYVPYIGPRLPTADLAALTSAAAPGSQIAIRRELFLGTEDDVLERAAEHMGARFSHHDRGWGFAADAGVQGAESLESFAIAGRPDACIEQLQAVRDAAGGRPLKVILRCSWPSLSRDEVVAMVHGFGREVLPTFR
ncbi:LLM class flavin-dependent oxidoreductase [Blastococcus saxobsidens]|uniref:Putative Flavin-dependent oxidoreductase, F420-dependent methylene-tetrahydromethanopterin reductase n=1 Tax=Blastococcus saxobsidens (strain DD2) TaxID=1146883 RepID=H6RNL8_BLASD|nr:LLM class flavin-dependent oxidoreductase [Blastococcus saxobsidens]CCG05166.1 putative Flavin-dependent oxidoreductase, F420-dependent methylene-tetrahydromethanopterin reductase [Blastococcus saxobsidens DD2]